MKMWSNKIDCNEIKQQHNNTLINIYACTYVNSMASDKHLWHLTFLARKKELHMVQQNSDQGRKGRQVLKTDLLGVQKLLVIIRHFDTFLCLQVECKLVLELYFFICVCNVDNSDLSQFAIVIFLKFIGYRICLSKVTLLTQSIGERCD